jgi:hypothetical protein
MDLSGGLSTDAALELLSDARRRELLMALLERDLRDGADARLSVEEALAESEKRDLELRLHHSHLPKLESTGVVDWRRDANEIRTGRRFDELRPLLRLLHDNSDVLPDDRP